MPCQQLSKFNTFPSPVEILPCSLWLQTDVILKIFVALFIDTICSLGTNKEIINIQRAGIIKRWQFFRLFRLSNLLQQSESIRKGTLEIIFISTKYLDWQNVKAQQKILWAIEAQISNLLETIFICVFTRGDPCCVTAL